MRIFAPVLFVLSQMPVSTVAADTRQAVRAACMADVTTLCGPVFSRWQALACLVDKRSELSPACGKALDIAACKPGAPALLRAGAGCHE